MLTEKNPVLGVQFPRSRAGAWYGKCLRRRSDRRRRGVHRLREGIAAAAAVFRFRWLECCCARRLEGAKVRERDARRGTGRGWRDERVRGVGETYGRRTLCPPFTQLQRSGNPKRADPCAQEHTRPRAYLVRETREGARHAPPLKPSRHHRRRLVQRQPQEGVEIDIVSKRHSDRLDLF